uniref:Uncharacterized protein n=1 Tax=Oryza sativa subsp. japonica TaxID=39947 RepID=Q69MJ0_ORYSJ|nr:hypothetical protein [Oryza sativa Japonica Group]
MGRRPRRRQPPWASLVLLLPVVPEIDDAEALAIKPRKDQRSPVSRSSVSAPDNADPTPPPICKLLIHLHPYRINNILKLLNSSNRQRNRQQRLRVYRWTLGADVSAFFRSL